ncbi:unnamed protein product, partial [Closterium sp. Naga37s-1]
RSSVNRPPTPEPEGRVGGGGEPTSLRQVVDAKLLESGEKERLKTLLRDRLEECGWTDDLLVYARAYVSKVGRENVSLDELIRAITPKGRGQGCVEGRGACLVSCLVVVFLSCATYVFSACHPHVFREWEREEEKAGQEEQSSRDIGVGGVALIYELLRAGRCLYEADGRGEGGAGGGAGGGAAETKK